MASILHTRAGLAALALMIAGPGQTVAVEPLPKEPDPRDIMLPKPNKAKFTHKSPSKTLLGQLADVKPTWHNTSKPKSKSLQKLLKK